MKSNPLDVDDLRFDTMVAMKYPSAEDAVIKRALVILSGRLRVPGSLLGNPSDVTQYLSLKLAALEHEIFGMLLLDVKNRLICDIQLFRGTLTQTSVFPREVIKEALSLNASSVVIYHNHPSGMAEPSLVDKTLTTDLKKALKFVDITILDHIIIAGMDYYSFSEKGLL